MTLIPKRSATALAMCTMNVPQERHDKSSRIYYNQTAMLAFDYLLDRGHILPYLVKKMKQRSTMFCKSHSNWELAGPPNPAALT